MDGSGVISRQEGMQLARALLAWTGWSQQQLASALRKVAQEQSLPTPGADRFTVNRWVTGRQRPTAFYVRLLLDLMTRLRSSATLDPEFADRLDRIEGKSLLLRLMSEHSQAVEAPSDRGPRIALAFKDPSRRNAAREYLSSVLLQLIVGDWMFGARYGQPAVAGLFDLTQALLPVASATDDAQLLRLTIRYTELAGWLHQDRGNVHAATSWTAKALELATRYRDDVMTSYILSRKSMHAASRRDARLTLELARSAQEPPHLPPRVRAVSLVMEAYGRGLLGDADSCLRGFDRASDVIDSVSDVDGDDGDAVARYCTLSFVDVWRA
ncbi:MAG: hypothetical protein JOZ73_07235, partial [Solirubrobacterales bacterium]|nr:hypothetical protein [Solirubrobacterales bacterium]